MKLGKLVRIIYRVVVAFYSHVTKKCGKPEVDTNETDGFLLMCISNSKDYTLYYKNETV